MYMASMVKSEPRVKSVLPLIMDSVFALYDSKRHGNRMKHPGLFPSFVPVGHRVILIHGSQVIPY